jgi:hypothetical protein
MIRSTGTFLLGFGLVVAGVLVALWKLGIMQQIDPVWLAVGIMVLVGLGIIAAWTRARPPTIVR